MNFTNFKCLFKFNLGQLTNIGEQQCFELGRRIRKKYVENLNFLSKEYDPNEI